MNKYPNTPGIYKILHTDSGKAYVGSSVNIRQRIADHRKHLRKNSHANSHLQNCWNKYGEESFEFSVLELVNDKTQLLAREQHWMGEVDALNKGFNIAPLAGTNIGRKATEETRAKLRAAMAKRTISKESRMLAAEANRGKKRSPEFCAAMSARKKGVKMTPEQCLNISRGRKGVKINPNLLYKWGVSNIGKPCAEETKRKISEAQKGKTLSPEHIANLVNGQRARREREAAEKARRLQR